MRGSIIIIILFHIDPFHALKFHDKFIFYFIYFILCVMLKGKEIFCILRYFSLQFFSFSFQFFFPKKRKFQFANNSGTYVKFLVPGNRKFTLPDNKRDDSTKTKSNTTGKKKKFKRKKNKIKSEI